jgi:predicted transcriptional regulator
MKRQIPLPGGELEYAVMAALWDLGAASARELHERVGAPTGLVYTTVAKVLDRLHAKGLVSRSMRGNAFVYRAKLAREVVERARTRDVVGRLFGHDPAPAIAPLVEALEDIDPNLLDELAQEVEARRRSRRGS